ncbi:MAG: hypothetical protein ACJA0N_000685 [Pseudohongiellaceae bacterium]|jgi:hypothetical protein
MQYSGEQCCELLRGPAISQLGPYGFGGRMESPRLRL